MNQIQRIINDFKAQPRDERQAQERGVTAWYAMIALFIAYVLVGIGYSLSGQVVPWTSQFLFYVPLIVFAIVGLKRDTYTFTIPGIEETETTLEQPSSVRSVPWLMLVNSILSVVFYGIVSAIYNYIKGDHVLIALIFSLVFSLPSLAVSYYFAERLKRGDKLFINLYHIATVGGILGSPILALMFGHAAADTIRTITPADIYFFLANIWSFGVLLKYTHRMIEDGKSYKKLKSYNEKDDKQKHWTLVLLYVLIPLVIFFLFFATALYYASQPNSAFSQKIDKTLQLDKAVQKN